MLHPVVQDRCRARSDLAHPPLVQRGPRLLVRAANPAVLPAANVVTVTATSTAQPAKAGSVALTITQIPVHLWSSSPTQVGTGAFTLRLNGPATLASVQANVWCSVEGLGERVAIRLIDGKDRTALLKSQGLEAAAAKDPLSIVTLACNRTLTPSAKVQIVYGQGVSTPPSGGNTNGVANTVEKRFSFQVREPFAASFSCERENAQSACLPLRPMRLTFNAPVSAKLLDAIRLKSDKQSYKPTADANGGGDEDSVQNAVVFDTIFPEQTAFTLELPKGFKDASGRGLRNADSFPLKVATAAMPPLAKFAAAPFGIVERFAEPDGVAMLPVTLRKVEAALHVQGHAGSMRQKPAIPHIPYGLNAHHYKGLHPGQKKGRLAPSFSSTSATRAVPHYRE